MGSALFTITNMRISQSILAMGARGAGGWRDMGGRMGGNGRSWGMRPGSSKGTEGMRSCTRTVSNATLSSQSFRGVGGGGGEGERGLDYRPCPGASLSTVSNATLRPVRMVIITAIIRTTEALMVHLSMFEVTFSLTPDTLTRLTVSRDRS